MQLADIELADIPEAVWLLLQSGVEHASDPLHTPCLGTFGRNGPELRTVVLRHIDPGQRLLVCHTDRRSGKAREIIQDPRTSWHFYDRDRKLQLRMNGNAVLHTDDAFADICWEKSAARSRSCYNTASGPGQPVAGPPTAPSAIGSDLEAADARAHFSAIACHVKSIEWLYLSGTGHRRARMTFKGSTVAGGWLTP